MPILRPTLRFKDLRPYFTAKSGLDRLFIFLAERFIAFLEAFLGQEINFDASRFDVSSGISPKNQRLLNILKEKNIIQDFGRRQGYPDEPKFFSFSVRTVGTGLKSKGDQCGGQSLKNIAEAVSKAIGESLERYSLYTWDKKDLIFGTYYELKQKGALDPLSFAGVGPKQRQDYKFKHPEILDENSTLGWIEAREISSHKKVLVPAQLIFLTYHEASEPVIYNTNTTGAACGSNFEEAAYRGLCEAIERDAWMITYYNKLSPPVIDLAGASDFKNPELIKLLNLFKRYCLEPLIVDMTTDIKVPSVLGIVRDEHSSGRIGLGAKADLDIEQAILGALLEAQKNRVWVRYYPEQNCDEEKILQELSVRGNDLIHRARFWNTENRVKDLEFLWQGPRQSIKIFKYSNIKSYKEKLDIVLGELKNHNYAVYAKEVTIPEAKRLGFCVVKILVPELQPMHLFEGLPFLGGRRLYEIPVRLGYFVKPKTFEELNNMPPHPFA